MFYIEKTMEVAGAHCLSLSYPSKCVNVHGHNWIITVRVESPSLNKEGMVVDFGAIKEIVNKLDHHNLNEVLPGLNPTAENIARWIADEVTLLLSGTNYKANVSFVRVQESEGNVACYTQ